MVLYTNDCPKCKILKSKLNEANIEYSEFTDVNKMVEYGIQLLPMLEIETGEMLDFDKSLEYIQRRGR